MMTSQSKPQGNLQSKAEPRAALRATPARSKFSFVFMVSVLIMAICIISIPASQSTAFTKGALPYGGRITFVQYCCDGSVMLTVVGKKTQGNFIFSTYASRLYRNFNVFIPGPNVVGDANPGGYCQTLTSSCYSGMYGNTIMRVGTSNI